MAQIDQYVEFGYYDTGYAVGDLTFVDLAGLSFTGSVGGLTVVVARSATVLPVGFFSITSVGNVSITSSSLHTLSGVSAAFNIGSITNRINVNTLLNGIALTTAIGNITFSGFIFDYNAVANLYNKTRTVYVEKSSTQKERTVSIQSQNRVVYVNNKPLSISRTVYINL
jgi:hypothetical protein